MHAVLSESTNVLKSIGGMSSSPGLCAVTSAFVARARRLAAGDADRFPDAGPPWRPSKLYYQGFWSRARIRAQHDWFVEQGEESPFDAEEAADHVAAVFGADNVEVEEWEYADCWVLPTYDAVVDYLYAFSVPEPEERAKLVTPPVGITKKGTNVWAVRA